MNEQVTLTSSVTEQMAADTRAVVVWIVVILDKWRLSWMNCVLKEAPVGFGRNDEEL